MNEYVTASSTNGERYEWHVHRPYMTWTSKESFATLEEAVATAQRIAHSRGCDYRNGTVVSWEELDRWNNTPYWQEPYDKRTLEAWEAAEKAEQEEDAWKQHASQW